MSISINYLAFSFSSGWELCEAFYVFSHTGEHSKFQATWISPLLLEGGILVSLLQWAPEAISSRKSSRTPFVLQCQNASSVSDLDNENRSKHCLSQRGEI